MEEIEIATKAIEGVSTDTAGFVGMAGRGDLDKPALITSWGEFVEKFGRYAATQPYLAPAVYGFFANGGRRCYVVRVKDGAQDSDYIGTDGGPGAKTGLQAFKEIGAISIVCIPGIASDTVQKAMITHCEAMKDRFCILDPIENADVDAIKSQKERVVSERGYAALYYPWIKVNIETMSSGKVKLIQDFVPPSGYLAGIYAHNDAERGPHRAPANQIIRGALDIRPAVTKREQDILNPLGINCIRIFPGRGILVWGARTIASDSIWKYINVRRLILYLEESIDEGTQWAVFEPNDEKLWARVRQIVVHFLTRAWMDGALMGATQEKAFFVKCDRTTMTQDDVDNGRLIIVIGVAPIKPDEFVIFRIAQWTGGSELYE